MDIAETLTSVEDQVLETTKTVQDQVVEYVRKAVTTVDDILPDDRPAVAFADQLPAPADLVERGFGLAESLLSNQSAFAQKVLEGQHEFVKAIVDAISPLLPRAAVTPAKPKPKVVKTAA